MRNKEHGAIARHAKRLKWCLSQSKEWSLRTFQDCFGLSSHGAYWWLRTIETTGLIARQVEHPHCGKPQMYKRLFKLEPVNNMTPCKKHSIWPCAICHKQEDV